MIDNDRISAAHAVYARRLPIVLGTKYRRTAFTPALREALRAAFAELRADGRCTLTECGGAADHVHLLVGIPPALLIATWIHNLKSASSCRRRNRFADHLRKLYWKP